MISSRIGLLQPQLLTLWILCQFSLMSWPFCIVLDGSESDPISIRQIFMASLLKTMAETNISINQKLGGSNDFLGLWKLAKSRCFFSQDSNAHQESRNHSECVYILLICKKSNFYQASLSTYTFCWGLSKYQNQFHPHVQAISARNWKHFWKVFTKSLSSLPARDPLAPLMLGHLLKGHLLPKRCWVEICWVMC